MADKYLKESGTQLLVSLVKNSVNNALSKLNYYSEGSNTATLSTEHIYVTSKSSIEMLSTNGGSYINLDNSYVDINATNLLTLASGNWSAANTGMINISASIVNVSTLNMHVNANISSILSNSYSISTKGLFYVNADYAHIDSNKYIYITANEELRLIGDEEVNIRSNEGGVNIRTNNYPVRVISNNNIYLNCNNGYALYNGNEIATVNLIEKLQEEMDNYVFEASFVNGNIQVNTSLQSNFEYSSTKYTITVGDDIVVNNSVTNGDILVNIVNSNMQVLSPRGHHNSCYVFYPMSGNGSFNITKCTSDYFRFRSYYYYTNDVTSISICPVTFAPNMSHAFYNYRGLRYVDGFELCSFTEVTNMSGIFFNCGSLTSVSNWFADKCYNSVEYVNEAFHNCSNLTYITPYSESNIGTGHNVHIYFDNVVSAHGMFNGCSNLTFAPSNGYSDSDSTLNTAYLPNIYLHFNNCTDLCNMFVHCTNMRGKFILYAASNANVTGIFNNAGYEVNVAGGSHSRSIQVAVENANLFDNMWRALGNPSVSYANSNRVPYWTDSNNSSKWNIRLYNNVASMMNDNNARYTT